MFYQIKIIRKGTKPPVWRRALVPSNITFAQLAIIMETITNVRKSSKYEFEFYQKKHKILEILPDAKHEYSYTLKNAADFFIDEYLQNESWFNFRINDSLEPEYRVEIEKSIPEVRFRDGILKYPLVIKQVSDKDDSYWKCDNGINEILREKYKIILSDNSNQKYLNMKELVSLVDEQGIIQDKEANNNNDKTILSMTKYMEDLGKAIMDKYTNPERFQNLMNKFQVDEETGKIITSGEEAQRIIEEYYDNEKEILEKEISKLKSEIYKKKELLSKNRKKSTVEDILNSFPKNDIEDIARENAVVLKSKTKSAMAFELARAILEPDFMRKKLVVSSEKEIKAFESAMEKGCYYPEDDEIALLDSFIENIFVGYFEDGMIEVPEEVKFVYAVLQRTNYKEYHQKAHWLYKCMDAFCRINVVASEDVLYKMYQQNGKIDNSHEAYESLLANFPDEYKIVCFQDGLVFDSNILKNKMYLKIRNTQRNIDDYIPTKEDILAVSSDYYPSNENSYKRLLVFYHDQMKLEDNLDYNLTAFAFRIFSEDGMLSDYMKIVNENEVIFDSEKMVESFSKLMMDVSNNTRRYMFRGHKPIELHEFDFPVAQHKSKVYPNDPCPCGSGKKFKKCCGNQRKD